MISMIFAMDPTGLIGKNNDLPWNYPEDLQYFKYITLNKTVLMGVTTFESIVARLNKPLPNRKSIVASLNEFSYPGVEVINDLESFLKKKHKEEIFVIGGKTIYEIALPYADKLYITHIKKVYEGDTYLDIDLNDFKLIKSDDNEELNFAVYERIK
ncbi:MAG: dihydrofolate reductase [Candidatus Izemoplasmatales bacterium]|nr:dihydrofolate reductase [Candidatus Izemoplasmatales bacterium]MDD4069502.1 dihydrofolate reductase [Candidatus Izemoplasmatales bacterium]MDY0139304.1 dihydrofolate reductase [Candidatus Izemoplasmatales bacterium]